jgi:hypothetical protein
MNCCDMNNLEYLEDVVKQFRYYKLLGERAMAQVNEKELFFQYHQECNSIGQIVKHLCGNMLSRWTDFLNSDGEKEWRHRDQEFVNDLHTRNELMIQWEKGWSCLFDALATLGDSDLNRIIYIRNQGHSVMEAINRQLAHYAYHVGQIVFLCKLLKGQNWSSLTIPIGDSDKYNQNKMKHPKEKGHFTDDFLSK